MTNTNAIVALFKSHVEAEIAADLKSVLQWGTSGLTAT
jgi:hypothetical protein